VQSDLEGDRQVLAFARSAIELALRVVKLVSRLQWKDGFGAHSGPSRGDYSRRAFRPTEASKATNVMSGLRRFETSLKRLKCANSGHSQRRGKWVKSDPLLSFSIGSTTGGARERAHMPAGRALAGARQL
jgi:hypothetical protein